MTLPPTAPPSVVPLRRPVAVDASLSVAFVFRGASWMPERLIIAIDGPAGTGKSTVARMLAKRLHVAFLDTGAMYRAAALIAVDHGMDLGDGAAIVRAVEQAHLRFDWTQDPPNLICGGRSVMEPIREERVTKVVSPVAGIAELRALMVSRQREIARERRRLVTEGRDQGSVVFPDADVKFYLDASPQVRAERRYQELVAKGITANRDQILTDIIERDRSDATRAVGPLVCPPDAIRIDTSDMNRGSVVDELERRVRAHVAVGDEGLDEQERAGVARP